MIKNFISLFTSKKDTQIKNLSNENATLRNEIEVLKKRQTPPNQETVLIYTDNSGVNWFGYKNFEYLSNARRNQYLLATSALELNLTKQEMNKYLDAVNNLVFNIEKEPSNKAKIVSLNERIRERLELAAYYKVIADLINIFYFIEGENPNEVNEIFFARKTDILKKDKEAREFFFVLLTQNIYNFKDISDTELLDYLLNQVNEKLLHLHDLE